jgi:hypothetical protein
LVHQLNTIAAPIGLVNRVVPLATLDIPDLFQRLLDTVNVHDGIDPANTGSASASTLALASLTLGQKEITEINLISASASAS